MPFSIYVSLYKTFPVGCFPIPHLFFSPLYLLLFSVLEGYNMIAVIKPRWTSLGFFRVLTSSSVRAALVFLVFLLLFSSTENNVRKKRARPFSTFFFPTQFRYNRSKKKWNGSPKRRISAVACRAHTFRWCVSTKVLGVFYILHGARRGEMHKVQIVSFDIISLAVRVWSISCLIDFFFLSFADLFFGRGVHTRIPAALKRREWNCGMVYAPVSLHHMWTRRRRQEDIYVRRARRYAHKASEIVVDVCAQAVCYYCISFMCRREVWFCLGSLEEKMAR